MLCDLSEITQPAGAEILNSGPDTMLFFFFFPKMSLIFFFFFFWPHCEACGILVP